MRLFALVCLPMIAAWGQTPKPEALTSLHGQLRNAVTGEPVAKAVLRLVPAADPGDWSGTYAATSEATGKFAFREVPPGKYRLRASRNGFVTTARDARR